MSALTLQYFASVPEVVASSALRIDATPICRPFIASHIAGASATLSIGIAELAGAAVPIAGFNAKHDVKMSLPNPVFIWRDDFFFLPRTRAGPRHSGSGLHVVVEPELIARVVLRLDLL